MNKFTQTLAASSKSIRASRAATLAEDVQDSQNGLLTTLKKEYRELQRKREILEDMHPDTEFSLHVAKSGFDSEKWVTEMQNVKVAMLNKQVEIKVATETLDEWFTIEVAGEAA